MTRTVQKIYPGSEKGFFRRLSWGAIIAGLLIAIAVQLLLSLLGMSIGFASIDPLEDANPFSGLGTGALIWWVLSMLISLFAGGWVAGWFSNQIQKTDLMLHGVIMWCLLTFFNIYLVTSSVGKIIGGVGTVVNKGFSLVGSGIKGVAPSAGDLLKDKLNIDGSSIDKLKDEAELLLKQTGKKELQPESLKNRAQHAADKVESTAKNALENPEDAPEKADSLFSKLFSKNEDVFDAADKDALVNIVVRRTGKSKEESQQIVDNWIKTIGDAKQKIKEVSQAAGEKAKKVGDDVAAALSKFAIFSFIGLLLGAIVASIGAGLAARRRYAIDSTTYSTTEDDQSATI